MKIFEGLFEGKTASLYTIMLLLTVISLFVTQEAAGFSVLGLCMGLWFLTWIAEGGFRSKFDLFKTKWLWPGIVLYFLYIIGIFYSDQPGEAAVVIEQKATLLLAPLLIGAGFSLRKNHLASVLFVFVNTALAASALALVLALKNGFAGMYETQSVADFITYEYLARAIGFQPIYLSLYLVFAFFALFALYRDPRFTGQWFHGRHLLSLSGLGFLFLMVVLLSSRMELLVLFVTAGLLLLVFVRDRKKVLRAFGVMALIGALGAAVIFSSAINRQRFAEMFDFDSDYTENVYGGRSIRIQKWKNALECWLQSPLWGVGTGDSQSELNKMYEKNGLEIALHYQYNTHNQYLGTLLTLGIPGFLALMAWMGSLFWLGFRRGDWLLASFASVVAFSMITENMLQRQMGVVFIALFSALLVSRHLRYFRPESSRHGN